MALERLTGYGICKRYAAGASGNRAVEAIVNLLREEEQLPTRCRPHPLRGEWTGHGDCHVEPDWLLLYRLPGKQLVLVRTGSHTELFGWATAGFQPALKADR